MLRAYLELAKKSFKTNIVYRLDYFAGLVNCLVMIFVNIAIWKAIYENEISGGIQFKFLVTYIILSYLLQTIFQMDEFLIENKIKSGLISFDILKPIRFSIYIFSYHIGNLVFKLLLLLLPMVFCSIVFFNLLPPFSLELTGYFLISTVLGFLVLYQLNFIVWMSSFWFYWIFSLVTIKDSIILILSGALVPIWFFPPWLSKLIEKTPFESIFYTPISIYLGRIPENEIIFTLGKQVIWIVILFIIGQIVLKRATGRLVVQGG